LFHDEHEAAENDHNRFAQVGRGLVWRVGEVDKDPFGDDRTSLCATRRNNREPLGRANERNTRRAKSTRSLHKRDQGPQRVAHFQLEHIYGRVKLKSRQLGQEIDSFFVLFFA
jgi:hypothetical protein